MVSFSLAQKTALVTGASRGIGEAIALTLAERGAHCLLVSRKLEGLQAVVKKIRHLGGKAEALVCNTGYPDQIESLYQNIQDQFGRLDILINNAATNPHFGEMATADEAIFNKTVEVNLKGPFFMIKHAIPLLIKNGGAIVNVSSVNGIRTGFWQGIYSLTKAGLISMTQTFAKELAKNNIRVNALLPGLTDTKFSSAIIQNQVILDHTLEQVPLGRPAAPSEMAGAVLYLLSDASSYTTGASIVCDGGLLV